MTEYFENGKNTQEYSNQAFRALFGGIIPLYMVIPPKYAVSKVMETIKKNISRSLSRKFAFLKKVYWDRKGIWGKEYFVSTVGINEEVIRRYVKLQEKEETG